MLEGFVVLDIDVILDRAGFDVSGGIVIDPFNWRNSGLFGAVQKGEGLNVGASYGAGGVLRTIAGDGYSVDMNILGVSVVFIFDSQGFNGIAFSGGPGVGGAIVSGETQVATIQEVIDLASSPRSQPDTGTPSPSPRTESAPSTSEPFKVPNVTSGNEFIDAYNRGLKRETNSSPGGTQFVGTPGKNGKDTLGVQKLEKMTVTKKAEKSETKGRGSLTGSSRSSANRNRSPNDVPRSGVNVITDPEAIAAALGSIGDNPDAAAQAAMLKIQDENER